MAEKELLFKVCMFGPAKGGKTSLLQRLETNCFNPSYKYTIGVEFHTLPFEVGNAGGRLQWWDTAGQERFRAILNAYFRESAAVVLVYDVSDEKSFSDLQTEYDRCLDYVNKEDVFMVLVGNKSDLKSTPDYTEAGRMFAKDKGIFFITTSAQNGSNVKELFNTITARLCNPHYNPEAPSSDEHPGTGNNNNNRTFDSSTSNENSMVTGSSKSTCWGFCCSSCDDVKAGVSSD